MTRYGKRSQRKSATERTISLRLVQLLVCLVIFSTVYVSKGVFPYKIQRLGDEITTLVTTTVDLKESFTQLGESLVEGNSVLEELGTFCVEVFGGEAEVTIEEPLVEEETTAETEVPIVQTPEAAEELTEEVDTEVVVAEEPAIMAVGQVYIAAEEGLRELPAGYTYDMLSLGGMERVTPVLGVISSGYGYRDHPLSGQDLVHNGVDIVGDVGDPIYAFGGGTVEYIGESDIYGNYLRIDHGNGVKSFYAHCNQLLVTKGDVIEVGDIIAEVGATGNVTGPHLHFELLCNDVHIDPALYIDSL